MDFAPTTWDGWRERANIDPLAMLGLAWALFEATEIVDPRMAEVERDICSDAARPALVTSQKMISREKELSFLSKISTETIERMTSSQTAIPEAKTVDVLPFAIGVLHWVNAGHASPEHAPAYLAKARAAFEEQLSKYPKSDLPISAVRVSLSEVLIGLGDHEGALAAIEPLFSSTSQDDGGLLLARLVRAEALLRLQRKADAIAEIESLAQFCCSKPPASEEDDLFGQADEARKADEGRKAESAMWRRWVARIAALEMIPIYSSRGECEKAADLLSRLRESGVGDCTTP